MDENRVSGTVRNVAGKAEQGFGRVTGDTKSKVEGVIDQVAGTAQDLYGKARDNATDLADSARDSATSFEKMLRNTIENQPYTAVAIALGLGWLFGRMHRPL